MPRLMRRNAGSGHSYQLDGEPVIGVTTAIDKGVPKPALINWAAEQTAMAAVEQRDKWERLSPYEAVKWLTNARWERQREQMARGSVIHDYAHRLMAGEEVEPPEAILAHVDSCIAFLKDFAVTVEWTETPVAHTGARSHVLVTYAGTLDLVAIIDGKRWLLDWKTGKAVYGDTALQLAAYRYCDLALIGGHDVAMPEIDRCGVVHLRADGYDLYPVEAGERQWRAFLHAVGVARFTDTSRELVGAAIHAGADDD